MKRKTLESLYSCFQESLEIAVSKNMVVWVKNFFIRLTRNNEY
jgi:hypothetical protein